MIRRARGGGNAPEIFPTTRAGHSAKGDWIVSPNLTGRTHGVA